MLEPFPVGPALTPYDWAALRETYRNDIDVLELEFVAELYGISLLQIARDEAFCAQVEVWLDGLSDPVRAWFEFAYYLGSVFWEDTLLWNMRKPEEDHYFGPFPETLIEQIMERLLAGIFKYRDDRELMQNVHWLRYREMMGDTCLRKEHFLILEEALGYQIKSENDEYVKAMTRELFDRLREMRGENETDEPE